MVTIIDKGSDHVRLRSGSSHMMTKKTLIWVPICKEKIEVKVTFITVLHVGMSFLSVWALHRNAQGVQYLYLRV